MRIVSWDWDVIILPACVRPLLTSGLLSAPEPLARMYSPAYYRSTWIITAFDAGFATAMPIRPKFLRDLLSIAFTGYYLIYAREADEKVPLPFNELYSFRILISFSCGDLEPYVQSKCYGQLGRRQAIHMCVHLVNLLPLP